MSSEAAPAPGALARAGHLLALCKPRLNALTVFAVWAGAEAAGGMSDPRALWATLLGAAMTAGGSAAVNQWMERDADARMNRTRHRPIPARLLRPADALAFGVVLSVGGIALLAAAANPLTAALGAICVGSYIGAYTPLKRVTTLNTWVGTIPGALPPVMGVAAASGRIGPEAVFLFLLMVAWQLPHFLSIAWIYREDYRRGGFVMLPCVSGGEAVTARQAVVQAVFAAVVSLSAFTMGLAGGTYLAVSIAAGALFVFFAARFAARRTDDSARSLLRMSLVHLPAVLVAFAADRIPS